MDIKRKLRAAGGVAITAFISFVSANLQAGSSQLVSARNPALPPAVPGNGNSAGPILTPDGRYVVFVSTANDLTPDGNNRLVGNVFLRDRQSNTTVLVSTNINGTGGGNGQSLADAVSNDGRYVLFESDASDLVPGDTNGVRDVFVRDVVLGTTTLVSVSTNGGPANGASSKPVMTPDGRFVAFISFAMNLVANETNGISNVFVRDLLSGTTTLVTPSAAGHTSVMDTPVITPDGRFVAFASTAQNLVAGNTYSRNNIYVCDLLAGTTTWVSSNQLNQNSPAFHPSISDDGRYVTYKQANIGSSSTAHIYRFDAVASANLEVNTNNGGVPLIDGNISGGFGDDDFGPEMTPDGRFVVYFSGSTNGYLNIWDGNTLLLSNASVNTSGVVSTNTTAHTPVMSPDGRYLAFLCNATNMVTNTVSNGFHIYLRDLQLGTNYLVDVDTNGVGSTDITGTVPGMSSNGQFVAFASMDAGFMAGDNNQALDVFVRDVTNGTTELTSVRNTSVTNQSGGGISSISQASITPDGRWLVFSSRSDDLVTNDANNEQDVFVRDLLNGTNILVSITTNGVSPLGGPSSSPSITPDGRYVAFVSAATNLYAGDSNNAADIFIRDLQAGTTTLAFANTNGAGGTGGDASVPVMSSDARYLAFLCRSGSPTVPVWRDTVSNQTIFLTNVSSIPPSLSTNGRYVAYGDDNFSHVWVRDIQTGSNIFPNLANQGTPITATSMALSGDGTKLLYANAAQVVVADVTSGTNIFLFATSRGVVRSTAQWSADGRYVAFVTSAAAVSSDLNNTNDVYLCDLQTKTVTLVSMNTAHTGSANGPSDSPAVSGNGRFVVYRSFATDIVPGITNPPNLFILDRLTGSNSLITVEAAPASFWSTWVSQPAVSGDGSTLAFQSYRPNFAPATVDLNHVQDVFSQAQSPLLFADSDGDGIPDWWMIQYFGHPTGQAGDLSLAQDDADGDGMSNLQEYLTGTNPKDPNSVFKLQITPLIASNNVTLTWPSVLGKSYSVQFKNLLTDPQWSDVGSNIFVGGNQVSITVPRNLPSRYYRVLAVN